MVEQCLSLQWGVLPTGDTHTHTHTYMGVHTHTHTLRHLAMVVHVHLHMLHASDCSADMALFLAVTPPRTPFCGGAHHDQNYDVDTNECPQCSVFARMM